MAGRSWERSRDRHVHLHTLLHFPEPDPNDRFGVFAIVYQPLRDALNALHRGVQVPQLQFKPAGGERRGCL